MKQKKSFTKLTFNKETVADLDGERMAAAYGGRPVYVTDPVCGCQTNEPECLSSLCTELLTLAGTCC
jgi:hypothetical protein